MAAAKLVLSRQLRPLVRCVKQGVFGAAFPAPPCALQPSRLLCKSEPSAEGSGFVTNTSREVGGGSNRTHLFGSPFRAVMGDPRNK